MAAAAAEAVEVAKPAMPATPITTSMLPADGQEASLIFVIIDQYEGEEQEGLPHGQGKAHFAGMAAMRQRLNYMLVCAVQVR
eukprot:COSAG02_NODE_3217_length_7156_cov_5.216381_1_plen_82_part_00